MAAPRTAPQPAAAAGAAFYGRVEDQDGAPVSGAEVAASSGELTMLSAGAGAGVVRRFETQRQ